MKDEKDLNSTKMDQRGQTPDRQKKKKNSRLGHGCLSRECCVLSGRGLCDELVPHPEESYRVWCV
jgi:hypothetical protein